MKSKNSKILLKKIMIIRSFAFFSIFTGCLFPIINFNPESPVDLGIPMTMVIVLTAFWMIDSVGKLEAYIFKSVKTSNIVLLNFALVLFGLVFRYLLEFGEVSNTYNFTITNVIFQMLVLVGGTSFVYIRGKNK